MGFRLATLWLGLVVALSAHDGDADWVGTWGCAPLAGEQHNVPPGPGWADSSLRQIVHVSLGGEQVRLRLSNAFGTQPLVITAVHVAVSAGGSKIAVASDRAVTFGGGASVTIPAGALIVSDPVTFHLAALSDVAITMHVTTGMNEITSHPGSQETSYMKAGDAVSAADFESGSETAHWYIVNGLDVAAKAATLVAFGDSITDGSGATTNGNDRWPDDLGRRLGKNKGTPDIGIVNEGIGGNRLLRDGTGPNALARFDRDVLAQSGVRWVIVLEGINDIGSARASEEHGLAETMIGAYEQMIARAHAHGIRVYGATILPYSGAGYFRPSGEAIRQQVNTWIRTSGKFDGVIDWDAAMRDQREPGRLADAVDSGDHLHPSPEGYKRMAEAIDLGLFEAR